MPNPKIYTDELRRFQQEYNLEDYDLKSIQEDDKIRNVNSFLSGSAITSAAAAKYTIWATKTMEAYFNKQIEMTENGEYDLSEFSTRAFLADFEKLVDAQYRSELEEGQEYERKKYNEATIEFIGQAFTESISKINKPLPTLWKERLKDGSMKIEDMKNITTKAYDELLKAGDFDRQLMTSQQTNLIASYEAMKQLRESRGGFFGIFWKIFNFRINGREADYMDELTSKINVLKGRGCNFDKITKKLTQKTVRGDKIAVKEKNEEKPVEVKKTEKSPSKSKEKAVAEPVAGKLLDKQNPRNAYQFVKKVSQTMPLPSMGGTEMIQYGVQLAMDKVYVNMAAMNNEYDNQVAAGASPKEVMEKYACKVFVAAIQSIHQAGYENPKDLIVATQKYTDAILKEFSPCSLNIEGTKEAANGYVVNNYDKVIEEIKPLVGPRFAEQLEGAFNEAKTAFPPERERLFDNNNNHPFVEGGAKSPQIAQPSKSIEPQIRKGN